MSSTSRGLAVAVLMVVCMSVPMREAHSKLVITGPSTAAPGDQVTLSMELSAPLSGIDIDELSLDLDFDPGLLAGISAAEGALLTGTSFIANAPAGFAVASFSALQTGLNAGVLATWTLKIVGNADAVLAAHLQTSVIDNETTGEFHTDAFTIHVIPEPSLDVLLLAGLMLAGFAAAVRRHAGARSRR